MIPLLESHWGRFVLILFNAGVGVRIFFALSGFLITTLLLNEWDKTGRISISGFYERRMARIFPAFYTYFLFIILLDLLHWVHIGWQPLVSAATYTWNYGHWWWKSITNDAAFTLGHLWTLSLEEQFYLVWPACLVLLIRRGAKRVVIACVVLLPFVRVAFYFLRPSDRGELMMMFHTGVDTILWGVLGAFLARDGVIDRIGSSRFRAAIPWACGLAMFVLCPVLVTINRGFGVAALASIQGAATITFIFWLLSAEGGILRRLLESWPMVQIGLLSYSIYIWQEIFTVWDGMPAPLRSIPVRWLCILVSSALSYYLVEVPLRKRIRQWFSQTEPILATR